MPLLSAETRGWPERYLSTARRTSSETVIPSRSDSAVNQSSWGLARAIERRIVVTMCITLSARIFPGKRNYEVRLPAATPPASTGVAVEPPVECCEPGAGVRAVRCKAGRFRGPPVRSPDEELSRHPQHIERVFRAGRYVAVVACSCLGYHSSFRASPSAGGSFH